MKNHWLIRKGWVVKLYVERGQGVLYFYPKPYAAEVKWEFPEVKWEFPCCSIIEVDGFSIFDDGGNLLSMHRFPGGRYTCKPGDVLHAYPGQAKI